MARVKSKQRKQTKQKPKQKPKPRKPALKPSRTPAELARRGDVDALFAMMDLQSSSKNDRNAYKWLNAASDFGHDGADDRIDDVMEVSSMRYDDSRYETAAAHWELAAAYLEGTDGLPRDLSLASKHLELAFEHHRDLETINAGTNETYTARELLDRLPDDARRVLEAALAGDNYGRAIRYVERIRRLVEVNAPTVIIDGERRLLREVVDALAPPPGPGDIERMGTDPLLDELRLTEDTYERLGAMLELMRAEYAKRRPS